MISIELTFLETGWNFFFQINSQDGELLMKVFEVFIALVKQRPRTARQALINAHSGPASHFPSGNSDEKGRSEGFKAALL